MFCLITVGEEVDEATWEAVHGKTIFQFLGCLNKSSGRAIVVTLASVSVFALAFRLVVLVKDFS